MITRLLASTALALALSVPALAQTSTTTTTDTQAQSTETQGSTEMQTGASDSESTGGTAAGATATGEATTQTGETGTGTAADTSTTTTGEAAEGAAETSTTANGEATTDTSAGATGEAILAQEQPGHVRANKLIGAKVANTEGQDVGDVSDILLDEKGKVAGVLLSVGGFLGIGDKKVAVNWDEIQLQEDGEQIMVDMSKEQISEAPAFETIEEQEREQQAEGDVPPAGSTTGTATDATGAGTTTAQ